MSEEGDIQPRLRARSVTAGLLLFILVLGGAILVRALKPEGAETERADSSATRPVRPIVQFVREQAGLPDMADVVDRLCPSVAVIVPQGAMPQDFDPNLPAAFAYSADGWLVTAADLHAGSIDALFGDGRRVPIKGVRTDPVSGLSLLKSDMASIPLAFGDLAFPRVGGFGMIVDTERGQGCSATASMIGSDFLADGSRSLSYIRLRPAPDRWASGMALVGADGAVLGIATSDEPGILLPAGVAAPILDELVRGSPSASVDYGFRAIDFNGPISGRLEDVRSGASVAIVKPKTAAGRAGLQVGDIVTAVGDSPVSSASELSRSLDGLVGKAVLTVQRHGQAVAITLPALGR